MEINRLRSLVTEMAEVFVADTMKDLIKITEVVALGPVLQKEPYRAVLTSIIAALEEAYILDVDLLQGLTQLLHSASPGYIGSDDLVKILRILRIRLEGTRQQSTENSYHLTLAVSRVLDVMADHKVQDLDRVLEHEPLSAVLSGLNGSSDPYQMFQACYAFQALQYVLDDETALQAVLRHSAGVADGLIKITAIFKLDLASILQGLDSLQESLGSAAGVGSTVYEGVSSLMESGQSVLGSLKEEFGSGQKQLWYAAVKAASAFTRAGLLNDLQRLIYEGPCRCDPLFQWGICQLLAEIAVDPVWTSSTRQQAVHLLGHLHQHDQDWGRDESVKAWMLIIITQLEPPTTDSAVNATARALLKVLEHEQTTLIQHVYLLTTSSLLAKVYLIPDVEYDLHKFRLLRLEESKLRVLHARDDDIFLLMDEVQDFLASDKQVMLILGDSGSGKSTFNTHLESELLCAYTRGGPIPLFINLPAIDQPDHDMIEKQLTTDNFSNDQIMELKQHRQFVLICDGYDESQQLYLGQDYRSRFMPQSSDHYTVSRPDLFQEAVIVPFFEEQIENYVEQYVPLEPRTWTTEDYMDKLTTIPNLLELVKNPFLLTLALAALPGVTEGEQDLSTIKITRVQLYDTFVDHWISVNKRRLENREIFDQLLDAGFVLMGTDYSTRLALAIFEKQNGNPVVQYVHLKDKNTWRAKYFGQNSEARLLRESSPLARTGRLFRFLHRSILEYFFSRSVFDPSSVADKENEIEPQSVSASSSSSSGSALPDADGLLFKRNLLTESSVIQFLSERVMQHAGFEKQLLAVVQQSKTDATAATAVANPITILLRAGVRFNSADLRGIQIPGADLSNGQFDCAQFQGADLRNVNLTWSWLRRVNLSGAQMEGVRFGEFPQVETYSSVHACAFSPDEKMIVLGEYDMLTTLIFGMLQPESDCLY
ncbi:hypothetical protein BGZ96_008805 [Linnemannia gamsii]|uniref:Arm-like repeat domain-containing protein n=1 Tax=Linnemannia gamsii TaxID=64522 RepID=A0ABQ7JYA2_9FUNG|nr:hypothetical protein BGZ96_008805 [Linnemannia gamsii]